MRYVAFLRAVNVGGFGRLPMAELRSLCEAAGFAQVSTYIQSGNVIFEDERAGVRARLEAGLLAHMRAPVGVVLREARELSALCLAVPFVGAKPEKVGVLLMNEAPGAVQPRGKKDEEIVTGAREVFIHFPSGMGRSRLKLSQMDHGTIRNLNTLRKLAEMAG